MGRNSPALFRRFPRAAGRIPWVSLGDLPSPVEALPGLEARLAPARAFIKRDDLSSARYGGNKVRALEFILGDAQAKGARTLFTGGALGSHHVCATALFARRLGLAVEAVLWRQPWSERCAEALALLAHLGVRVHPVPPPTAALATLLLRWAVARARGVPAYLIPPGGLSPRGALGFVDAALELAEQIAAGEAPALECVWLPCGTGVSAAGLAVGLRLADLDAKVHAVRVTPAVVCNRVWLARLIAGTRRFLGQCEIPMPRAPRLPVLLHAYYAPGYGTARPDAAAATALLGAQGIRLDPTYSARAMAALLAGAPATGGTHLFWHTLSAAPPRWSEADARE